MEYLKGGSVCIAKNCVNKYSRCKISYFRFPKDNERCKQWAIACDKENLLTKTPQQLHKYRVCGAHFETKMFVSHLKNRLQPNAVPTIFWDAKDLGSEHNYSSRPAMYDLEKLTAAYKNLREESGDGMECEEETFRIFRSTITDSRSEDSTPLTAPALFERRNKEMHFLTSMCFICLKSKNDLNAIKAETLTKLLYFIEKGEDFIPHFNQTKICKDCLDKLDVAFHFKQMCLNNIVQFEEYFAQLQQTCNEVSSHNVTVDLIDVNKFKEDFEVHESTVLEHEQYLDKQPETVLIKEEPLDEIYYESYKNNETPKEYLSKDLNLLLPNPESIEASYKEELQNQSAEASNVYLNDVKQLKITDESEMHSVEQPETVFIKNEILDEIHLQYCESSEPQTQYPNEESKLLLHKEEILDDIYDERGQNQFRKISELNHSQSQELSETASNEGSSKNELFFVCAVCEKHFTRKSRLREHVMIHTAQKQYRCDKCQKCFIKKIYLRKHMLTHSNNWSHYCSVCNKGFHIRSRLDCHMLSHSNERPYSCSVCKKSFNHKSSRNRHMIVHSKDKPYFCPICMRNFAKKRYLIQHEVVHSKERPYSCSECKKKFKRKDSLEYHIETHSKEQSYSCSICEKSFKRKRILKLHTLFHIKE